MKKSLKISSLALLILITASCSNENDLIQEEIIAPSNLNNIVAESDTQNNLSTTSTTFLAESNAISELRMNQVLTLNYSGYSNFKLVMQNDSNLVLYYGNLAIWQSNTARAVGQYDPVFVIQNDRNAVIYGNAYYGSLWASGIIGSHVTTPYFKLQLIKEKDFFSGTSTYIKGVIGGDAQDLYQLFYIKL